MNDRKSNEWLNDYDAFLKADGESVPSELSSKTLKTIDKLLNPSPWQIFAKVSGIHAAIGFVSLSFCHQFGMNPFKTSVSLADWFMQYGGHSVCMFACGVLFLGLSILAAGYFLTLEEIKTLRKNEFAQTLAISAASLGTFAVIGVEMAFTIAGLWLLGALIGGFVATEAIWMLRKPKQI